jgi:hypothetical protein
MRFGWVAGQMEIERNQSPLYRDWDGNAIEFNVPKFDYVLDCRWSHSYVLKFSTVSLSNPEKWLKGLQLAFAHILA